MAPFVSKAMYFLLALVALPQTPVDIDTVDIDTADIRAEALARHNDFRALHGASPLAWSGVLETAANKWASKCVFKHSGGQVGPYGENLAAGTGNYTVTSGIKAWTDEIKDYNPQRPTPSHFTQVVWKSSKQLGCAMVDCPAGSIFPPQFGKAKYLVCEYSPPGNVIGQFPQNVQK